MKTLPELANGLAWLLEEAARGHLDPKGKDLGRVEQWLTDVFMLVKKEAMEDVRDALSFYTEEVIPCQDSNADIPA